MPPAIGGNGGMARDASIKERMLIGVCPKIDYSNQKLKCSYRRLIQKQISIEEKFYQAVLHLDQ